MPSFPRAALFAFSLLVLACGSDDDTDTSEARTSGKAGKAGAAGKSGSAGKAGSGNGSGGDSGAGSGGSGGGAAGGPGTGGPEVCGDGLDNNGNGLSDEGCPCNPGQTQSCFFGPADKAGKGACKLGVQVCLQSGSGEVTSTGWGLCEGSKGPVVEVCGDSVDNNCDGAVDEGCCKAGESVACSSECGDGQQVCQGGKLSACQVSTPKPGAPASCGGGACKEGETVACSNECGAGQQVCQGGKLSACKVDAPKPGAPASCGSAACQEGEVVVCSNECGDGQQVCQGGKLSACQVATPKPGAPASCGAACKDGESVACSNECGDGVQVCAGGVLLACVVKTPKPGAPASCGGAACSGDVPCQSACGAGMQKCVGGVLSACDAPLPSAEVCDGKDNNCNGQVDEGASASLQIAPNPFTFPATAVGSSVTQAFTLTPSGGTVTNVTSQLKGMYGFAGGSYPGVGGTCGAEISAPCTVVIEFRPKLACDYKATARFDYKSCGGSNYTGVALDGSTTSAGELEDVCPTTYEMFVSASSGDDANDGLSPQKPKKTLTAALAASSQGAKILMTGGTYNEAVIVTGCRKVFGGYDPSFTQRDPKLYESILSSGSADQTLDASVGGGELLRLEVDGLTILNTNPDGIGLYAHSGALIVRSSVVRGPTVGLSVLQSECVFLADNTIEGGATSSSFNYGLSLTQTYNLSVLRNNISYSGTNTGFNGGVDITQCALSGKPVIFAENKVNSGAAGVRITQNGIELSGNTIAAQGDGLSSTDCKGYMRGNKITSKNVGGNFLTGDFLVERNIFSGLVGISSVSGQGLIFGNNLIFGDLYGVVSAADAAIFTNNTVASSKYAIKFGIYSSNGAVPQPPFSNNLLLHPGGGGAAIFSEEFPVFFASSMENNVAVGFSSMFEDNKIIKIYSADEMNLLDDGVHRIKNNALLALPPAEVFVNLAGPDGKIETLEDNDWHLATTDPAITQGGKDASGNDCGLYSAPVSCGDVKTDFDGNPRSVPYSVGAFEK